MGDDGNTVSFHSIRRSRVTGGPDGDELWSLSRITNAVDEYVFCHGFPRKWLQSHIEFAKIILGVQRLEIEQSDPFLSDFSSWKPSFRPKFDQNQLRSKKNLHKWCYRVQKSKLVRKWSGTDLSGPFIIWKQYEGLTIFLSLSRSFSGVDEVTNWFKMSHVTPPVELNKIIQYNKRQQITQFGWAERRCARTINGTRCAREERQCAAGYREKR
jgi:hypothetical protein